MNIEKFYSLSISKKLARIFPFIFLAIITWIAHFWHFASFGLYEDDHLRVSTAMGMAGRQVLNFVLNKFLNPSNGGRFLHDGLIFIFSYLGAKLGGLYVTYWIGYLIILINVFLFYTLLRRLYSQTLFALMGALAFSLFPADLTQPFLTHLLGIQPSLTFLLIAFHCYISSHKSISYILIFASLLCYEIFYPVFWAAPLFKNKWDLKLKKELLRHTLVLIFILAFMVIVRKLSGESRVSNLNTLWAIRTIIEHMVMGPIMTMSMFLYRPIQTLLALNKELLVLLPICWIGISWFLSRQTLSLLQVKTGLGNSSQYIYLEIPKFFKDIGKLTLLGLILLLLAYPLTLNPSYSAFSITGKPARVHTAAILGASILCACIGYILMELANSYRKKRLATIGLAGFFTLLIGFGLIVQQDYKLSWNYQRAFWTDVIRLCPDMDQGTVILVEGVNTNRNWLAIRPYFPAMTAALTKIYRFPYRENSPEMFLLKPNWQTSVALDKGVFQLDNSNVKLRGFKANRKDYSLVIDSSDVILLENENGKLVRRVDPLVISNQEFSLKNPKMSKLPQLSKGTVYRYLINSTKENSINYLNLPARDLRTQP
ncbi:hypothetical protein [Crocosphaera sp.]|uniref:hypothetical protein n=1 Tax=Crocosphaera sp. TaxID=2729996 RepID=UPI00260AA749|nr:hypothetical protein [Crocosphaera sp.]MDJ0582862.1 hypothetical protein [Crocosphaera sp.]